METTMKYDHLIDIKGLCCAAPVLRLTREFKEFSNGDTALLVSDKSSMLKDIPAYCKIKNHALLKVVEKDGLYYFWILIQRV